MQPGLVVADRGAGDKPTVSRDTCHFHHRHIQFAKKAKPGQLRDVREMNVGVLHLPGIDLLAHHRVRLIGQAHGNAIGTGQGTVQFGRCRGTGPQTNAEVLARRV